MIRLYFNWNAVCALKVVLCLAEKALVWEERHLALGEFEQLQEWYLAINPAGVVPALEDNGAVVLESTLILEYLEDAYPERPLRPTDPRARARMRWWTRQVDDIMHPSLRPLSFTRFVAPRAQALSAGELDELQARTPKKEIAELWRRAAQSPYSDEELAAHVAKVRDLLVKMDETLGVSPWLAGDSYSLADVAMTPYVRRLVQLQKQELWADLPATADWWARVARRPAFAAMDDLRRRYAPATHPAASILVDANMKSQP